MREFDEKLEQQRHSWLTKQTKGLEAIYLVQANGRLKLSRGTRHSSHEHMWRQTKRMMVEIPAKHQISSFVVFDDINNRRAAFVSPQRQLNKISWILAFNRARTQLLGDLFRSKIHEYAHILLDAGNVVTLFLPNGCEVRRRPTDAGVFDAFQKQFWECTDFRKPGFDPWRFHRPHSATLVSEDLADSFTGFVLCQRPDERLWEPVWEKKRFFWKRPKYVRIRQKLRKILGLSILQQVTRRNPFFCDPHRWFHQNQP